MTFDLLSTFFDLSAFSVLVGLPRAFFYRAASFLGGLAFLVLRSCFLGLGCYCYWRVASCLGWEVFLRLLALLEALSSDFEDPDLLIMSNLPGVAIRVFPVLPVFFLNMSAIQLAGFFSWLL